MDIMIDIETLGTSAGAIILSIGAVAFNPLDDTVINGSYPEKFMFYQNFNVLDQLFLGMRVDPHTLEWWIEREEAARKALHNSPAMLEEGLASFAEWAKGRRGETSRFWANSPDFDMTIIEYAANLVGLTMPWTFRERCDLRTLMQVRRLVYGETPPPPLAERIGIYHNALDDALTQVSHVRQVLRELREQYG